jgi:UDP-N-acetylmuramyl pentapeptide phosphotransferase/UDP-N-acetylglucosamine-1-phosphate transferase
MNPLLWTSLTAFAASLLLTAVVRSLARRGGIVDRPDGKRKLHRGHVPLLGGVAVYGATVLGLLVARLGADGTTDFSELSNAWIIAAGFVCLVGGIDDRFSLPSRVKLALQIVSVLPIVMLGYYVDRIVAFGCPIVLGWLGIPLTILWLVGCINALNLIDGMDGLASIIGLSTATMLGVIAVNQGQGHVAAMAIVLAGSLAGFLLYNLPPASIFLGDSGSMVIGLSVGLLGIQGSLKTSATLAITAPAVVMTLPMFDIVAAIVRRTLNGRPFDMPDRQHIHHRLLDRGWSPWQVLCLLGAMCLTMGAAATAATIFRLDALAWIAAMSLIVLMIRLRLFGHDEFALVKGALVRRVKSSLRAAVILSAAKNLRGAGRFFAALRMTKRAATRGQPLRVLVAQATDADSRASSLELWDLLLQDLRVWNIRQVAFSSPLRGIPRRVRWIDPHAPTGVCHWSLSVSLPGRDGEICELTAAAVEPVAPEHELAALTSLLTAFGARFAAHADDFFGPDLLPEKPTFVETYPDQQRKAA